MKIPFLDIYIINGPEFRKQQIIHKRQQLIIQTERNERKRLQERINLEAKMTERQLHQLAVMQGKLKAPLCPKCGKPKIAGGIQWLDHGIGCGKKGH